MPDEKDLLQSYSDAIDWESLVVRLDDNTISRYQTTQIFTRYLDAFLYSHRTGLSMEVLIMDEKKAPRYINWNSINNPEYNEDIANAWEKVDADPESKDALKYKNLVLKWFEEQLNAFVEAGPKRGPGRAALVIDEKIRKMVIETLEKSGETITVREGKEGPSHSGKYIEKGALAFMIAQKMGIKDPGDYTTLQSQIKAIMSPDNTEGFVSGHRSGSDGVGRALVWAGGKKRR